MVRRNRGDANCDLLFEAQLPALGYEELHVSNYSLSWKIAVFSLCNIAVFFITKNCSIQSIKVDAFLLVKHEIPLHKDTFYRLIFCLFCASF